MTEAHIRQAAADMRRHVRALRDWHMDEAVRISAYIRGDVAEVDLTPDGPALVYRPWSDDAVDEKASGEVTRTTAVRLPSAR